MLRVDLERLSNLIDWTWVLWGFSVAGVVMWCAGAFAGLVALCFVVLWAFRIASWMM